MLHILKKILPVEIPSFAIPSYATEVAKNYLPQYRMVAQEVSGSAKGTLLDVATGPGILPLEIGKILPSLPIIGMDNHQQMIEIAQKNKKSYGLTNVDFRVMDAHALAFGDSTLGMIISTNALHHWKYPHIVLKEIYRCLKPGCEAWIYDGFSGAPAEDIDAYAAQTSGIFKSRFLIRTMLGLHGYSQKECDTVLKNMVAKSPFKTGFFEQRGILIRLCLRK